MLLYLPPPSSTLWAALHHVLLNYCAGNVQRVDADELLDTLTHRMHLAHCDVNRSRVHLEFEATSEEVGILRDAHVLPMLCAPYRHTPCDRYTLDATPRAFEYLARKLEGATSSVGATLYARLRFAAVSPSRFFLVTTAECDELQRIGYDVRTLTISAETLRRMWTTQAFDLPDVAQLTPRQVAAIPSDDRWNRCYTLLSWPTLSQWDSAEFAMQCAQEALTLTRAQHRLIPTALETVEMLRDWRKGGEKQIATYSPSWRNFFGVQGDQYWACYALNEAVTAFIRAAQEEGNVISPAEGAVAYASKAGVPDLLEKLVRFVEAH